MHDCSSWCQPPQSDVDRRDKLAQHRDQPVRARLDQGDQGSCADQHEGERGRSGDVHQAEDEDEDDDDDRQWSLLLPVNVHGSPDDWNKRTGNTLECFCLVELWFYN